MQTDRPEKTPLVLDLAQMSCEERDQRTNELRASHRRALGCWLDELASLERTGLRSSVTEAVERHDLEALRAGDPSRLRGIYPHEATPWAFVLTAHYLRAQEFSSEAIPIAAIGDEERLEDPRARRWLSSAERLLENLANAPDATLFELSLAQSIYCAAQRERIEALPPNVARGDDGIGSSHLAVLEAAAEAGDRRAAYAWALAELNGIGKPPRPDAGVHWMKRAASLGYSEAQYELGAMYANGWSVARDEVAGLAWFLAAQRTGHDHAQRQIDTLLARLPADRVARARRLSSTLARSPARPPRA